MIGLGMKVKDAITGFTGVVTARAQWLTGCDRFHVTSTILTDGKVVEEWFDENRLVRVDDTDAVVSLQGNDTSKGGPRPDPVRPTARR